MAVDVEALFEAVANAERTFNLVREIGDTIAVTLAASGQPELQERLREMREQNDADRERRRRKLAEWAQR